MINELNNNNMTNKLEVFLTIHEGECYIIPTELRDKYDGTSFYDREKEFSNYILPNGILLEEILINDHDLESIIEGDFY